MTDKPTCSREFKLVRSSDGLQEIVYCIAKRGTWGADEASRARLIHDAKSFEELKVMLSLFQFIRDDELSYDQFESAVSYLGVKAEIPELDRLLRWPWSEGYEAP